MMAGLCWDCYAQRYGVRGDENTLEVPFPIYDSELVRTECDRCGSGYFNRAGKRIHVTREVGISDQKRGRNHGK